MARYALVVGISEYKSSYLKNLSKPKSDAEAVAQLLRDHGQCERVTVLKGYVTAEELEEALMTLIQQDAAKNEAFIYFTGHGLAVKGLGGTKGFLATSDCAITLENKQPKRQSKAIAFSELNDLICDSDLSSLVMLIDACHSGEFIEAELVERSFAGLNAEQDYYLITSCRGHEQAWARKRDDHSIFTGAVLDVLVPGKVNNKGYISGDTVFAHLDDALKNSRQEPRRFGKGRALPIVWFPIAQQNGEESYGADEPKPGQQQRRNWAIPLQMPPLPEHFVERPEHQDAVKEQLLCETQKTGTLVVSAIHGLGGIGKSVLASKLAHDDDVRARFADGILWSTLGQNPDILPLLSGWIQALGDHDYKPTAIEAASNHLRTLLYDKRALLVVDDVWNPAHLEPFRVGGNGCCVLVTTREAKIPEAHKYSLDVMSPEQALELMTQKLKEVLSAGERQQALEFAARVGYLPLALELAAAQIEEGVTWNELFEDFRDEVVRLEALDLYGREDIPDDAKRRKYSLTACFNLSLKQLSAEQLRQFAWLGIVPEDVSLTQEMAVTLWQVKSRQAGAILRTFSSKALLLQGAKQAGAEGRRTYRMHDLMHDLAQRLLVSPTEPEKDGDLSGLGMTKAAAHREFLERYRAKTNRGQWHTLKDDGYIYDRLTWHMEQARQVEEIHELLRASNGDGRNGWYEACDGVGKPAGFVNDVGRAWELAKKNYENKPGETLVLLFRYALMRTSINSMASNVPAELVGALVEKEVWSPAQGLAYAQQAQNPWQRAACISEIVPYMPESLLPEVQKTVGQIKDAIYRSYVLGKLAEKFPQLWPDVLIAIGRIQDRYGDHRNNNEGFPYRAYALQKILDKLPADYLPEALAIAYQIENRDDRALALVTLSKQLPKLLPEALAMAREITDESARVDALGELAKQLSELLPEALAVTREIADESARVDTLGALAKQLPPELLPEALAITREITDESARAYALSELAEQLPPELLPEALAMTREISSKSSQAYALGELAKQLPKLLPEALAVTREISSKSSQAYELRELAKQLPKLLPEALAVTREISSKSSQAYALRELVKQLPELLPEALAVTREISNKLFRVPALRELAKQLPPELLPEALTMTREIADESARAYALGALAKQLPELLPEALAVTREISSEAFRAYALSALTKQLPELLPEALAVTREISEVGFKAHALGNLAKQLPPELLPEALAIAREIADESSRANALHKLSKQLPPELLPEALAVTREIASEFARVNALSALIKQLPELLPEALAVTREIASEFARAYALSELAKWLSSELLPEALAMAREIANESARANALGALAEQLPELLPEALAVTGEIADESSRAYALRALAEQLPELLPEALAVTGEIADESSRAYALRALAKQLPSQMLPEALSIALKIKDESSRARALSGLAEYLSEALLTETLEIMWQIQDPYFRAQALQGLLPYLTKLNITFTDWAAMLEVLAYQNRKDLLRKLPDMRPIILELGNEKAFSDSLQAVRDVCGQWP